MLGVENPYRPDSQPGLMGHLMEGLERQRLKSFINHNIQNFITERPSGEEVLSQRRDSWCDEATGKESKGNESDEDFLLGSSGANGAAASTAGHPIREMGSSGAAVAAAAATAGSSAPTAPGAASPSGRSVREMAAIFKGGRKPETPELFRRRQGAEAAANRGKFQERRQAPKNYSQDAAEERAMAAGRRSVHEIAALFGGSKRLGQSQDADGDAGARGESFREDIEVNGRDGGAPTPLEPDDPYKDFDAIYDQVGQERTQSPCFLWNFFRCCLGWR